MSKLLPWMVASGQYQRLGGHDDPGLLPTLETTILVESTVRAPISELFSKAVAPSGKDNCLVIFESSSYADWQSA
jgi:hypothetical protein